MIEQYFPSKRPVVKPYQSPVWDGASYANERKALKLGITLQEYEHRVAVVRKAITGNKWAIGMSGFPHSKEEMEKHGECRVVGIVYHFDQYGTVDWNEECPYLLAVRPSVGDVNVLVNCSIGWLTSHNPCLNYEVC